MDDNRGRLVLIAFWLEAVLAGGNAVGIRFSNRELDPLWGAGLRFGLAAVVLIAIVQFSRLQWPRWNGIRGAALFGSLNFGAGFGFAYYALTELHAGFGQILLALVPLATLLLAAAQGQERITGAALTGTILALLGVAAMAEAPLRGEVPVTALLAALASAACFAQAAILVRRLPALNPAVMNAVGMAVGAVILIVTSLLVGETPELPSERDTWLALAYLVLVGSIAVFGLYLFVLGSWPASRAAYVFVLIPFVTVALSAWLDNEPLRLGLVAGGLLVLAGVQIGALGPTRRAARQAE